LSFQKKTTVKLSFEQCDSGAWLHCSLNSGAMLHCCGFSPARSSKILLNLWHSWVFGWVLPVESNFFFLTKLYLVWLRVNFTRSHVTKQTLNVTLLSFGCNLTGIVFFLILSFNFYFYFHLGFFLRWKFQISPKKKWKPWENSLYI
jgi:hypothetical protein